MNKNLRFTIALFAIGLTIPLGVALGRYSAGIFAKEAANQTCSISMTEIVASAQGDVYSTEDDSDSVAPEAYYLVTYSVKGETITEPIEGTIPKDLEDEQQDTTLQTNAWDLFTSLISAEDRQMVVQYKVFTDGYSNTLAAVDQNRADPSQWILEIDIADLEDRDSLLFTLVHEYAHLLTLNASQVIPDQEIVDDPTNLSLQKKKAAACPNYFTGTGCSYPDSYVHVFYTRFWPDVNADWKSIDAMQYDDTQDITVYYDSLHAFYKSHADQFVDDYATTHPTEDIAEFFTYFVFSSKPTGDSIKEQKIAFFYEYPELVQLREDILTGACSLEK